MVADSETTNALRSAVRRVREKYNVLKAILSLYYLISNQSRTNYLIHIMKFKIRTHIQ